jgi:hypothetical protein
MAEIRHAGIDENQIATFHSFRWRSAELSNMVTPRFGSLALGLKYNAQSELFCFFWGGRSFFWLPHFQCACGEDRGRGFQENCFAFFIVSFTDGIL